MTAKCQNHKQHQLEVVQQKSLKHPLSCSSLQDQDQIARAARHVNAAEHSTEQDSPLASHLKSQNKRAVLQFLSD